MNWFSVARNMSRQAWRVARVVFCSAGIGSSAVRAQAASRRIDIDTAAPDRFVQTYLRRTGLPGAAVSITLEGRVMYVKGYGTSGDGTPISAQTRLPIASLSKSITALAVMQLVEAGKVALDEPVRRYLPEFVVADPRVERITVRQLLNHTSGMSDTEFREKSVGVPASLQAAVGLLRTAKLASDPGVSSHYHNPNYWVAARLVEVVSGEAFASYLQQHVFAPAGMTASSTVRRLEDAPDVARGHSRVYGVSMPVREPAWFLDGASGVVTTATDLAHWLIAHQHSPAGPTLVSAAAIDTLHASHFGWADGPDAGTFAHGGLLFTFTSQAVIMPGSGYGLGVITNRGIGVGPDDAFEIMRGLVALTHGTAPSPGAPWGRIADLVLMLFTAVTALRGLRALRGAPAWARRWHDGARVRSALGVLVWLVPVVLLVSLRRAFGVLFGGRDGTWGQLLYVAPSLFGWLVVAAAFGLAVTWRRAALASPPHTTGVGVP